MTVLLIAIICKGILCQEIQVPTEVMVAGLASDPIPIPYTEIMCRANGILQAQDYVQQQAQYKNWYVTRIYCPKPEDYVPKGRA